jgi:hypothetical protein
MGDELVGFDLYQSELAKVEVRRAALREMATELERRMVALVRDGVVLIKVPFEMEADVDVDALVAFLKAQDAPLRAEAERLTAAALASAGDDGASRGDA